MAVLDHIELPNGITYDISDASARKLDNNDFDTINVTELNAGDVIVTGAARFLNTINGDISGNAETATSATRATQDESGNNIKSTYANAISISDHTITLKNKNGTSLGTVTVPDNNTTYTVATGTTNGKIKVTPSSGSAYEVSVYGLKSAAYKDVTDSYSATGTDPVSGKAVAAAINGLPSPMVFRGSLGTGGTITALPIDGTAKVGDTYKVITAGTYASKAAKVGDTFICLTKTSSANTWELIPSGDEPSGTVTSVAVANGGGLSVSGSPITTSGTITISHADTSSQASVNNSGRTYIQDITLDTYGHVTGITSATETVTNTDRYVNSAAFVDATSADANNPVKMTLTRAGSDTASVTAYLPKVSSSSAGVAPKGAAVSTQSQSTKFLREDGTWAAPSYTTNTNTTYTIGTSGNTVTLTPSSGSVQSITVPYATSAGSATDNTKLPLAGGTMTGQIVLASNGYKTNNSAGYSVDQYGNFQHLGTTTSDYWQLKSNSGANKFSVYWETGNVTAAGTITASKFVGVNEADLQWGGKSFSGSYGCIDACLMDELGANRLQFIKASAITVEYSRDAGETWTDYEATDLQKQQIFAQGGGLTIGKADSTHKATEHPGEYQLRITIDTGVANIYTYLNKFVVYVSTNNSGGCLCKIQKALQSTPTTFVDHTDWITVTGWSGYNVLNTSYLVTYGNNASSQYGRVRFIFKDTESTGTTYNGLAIIQIKAFGGVGWGTPSTMAKTGHLYNYDQDQNAIFPKNVTATRFIGSADAAQVLNAYAKMEYNWNGVNYFNISGIAGSGVKVNDTPTTAWWHIMRFNHANSSGYYTDLAIPFNSNSIYYKRINAGALANNGWVKVFDELNLKSETAASGGTTLSLVTTGEKATWNAKASSDTKNTAGSTDTSSKIFLIGATSQADNPQTYSDDQVYVTNGMLATNGHTSTGNITLSSTSGNSPQFIFSRGSTLTKWRMYVTSGQLQFDSSTDGSTWINRAHFADNSGNFYLADINASGSAYITNNATMGGWVKCNGAYVNGGNNSTTAGIALYGTSIDSYGIAMRVTSNGGKHGGVQSDWAVYNYMVNSGTNRGWIWKNAASGGGNIASIDCAGNAVFNGYVGIGGNTTNTSGVRQVYNSTTKSLDFIFVS